MSLRPAVGEGTRGPTCGNDSITETCIMLPRFQTLILAALAAPLCPSAPTTAWGVPPIRLELAETTSGEAWIRLADPAGILNRENGITDTEAACFDCFGKLLITCSKADGRHPSTKHGKTAHVSLWHLESGDLVWDRKRSRGPDEDGDGSPDNQPANRQDEVEIAIWNPDGRFVAAGGEDDTIEVWRVREDDMGPDEWREAPVLVKTLTTGDGDPETDDAGIDSMVWSHDGRLLFAGTEQGGKIEVFRTQGEPAEWSRMHRANHGGRPGFAVNSLDLTEDDRYLGAVGTDTNGTFWRIDITEEESGRIAEVDLVKLATLPALNGKAIDGSGREARFEPKGDRHFIFTLERTGLVQVYQVADLIGWDGPPTRGPQPIMIFTNGEKIKDGNEIEPAVYSPDGLFLVHDGDTRVGGNSEGIFPGFLRIMETKEIREGAPMPDPVFVQRALATEFLDFHPGMSHLASGHGDGSVRVWRVHLGGTETIVAEAFNELTEEAGRWELFGAQSSGKAEKPAWGSSHSVEHRTAFRGHRGLRYLAAGNLGGETHALEILAAWDIGSFEDRGVQFAAAASPGPFAAGDFLRLLADTDGDDHFESLVAEFLPDGEGDLALGGAGGAKLNSVFLDDDGETAFSSFEDYFFDLEPLLPPNFEGSIRFRVEARTDHAVGEIAFDSLRVTGRPGPPR